MTKPSRHKRGLGTRHDAIRTRLLALSRTHTAGGAASAPPAG